MRKVFVFVILLLFNFFFIYGINYTNELMFKNDFMIYFKGKPISHNEEKEENKEELVVDTSYDGESYDDIGKKMDKIFSETLLEGYGSYIAKNSIAKGVNPYLIAGIILESTGCQNECNIILKQCNNVSLLKGEPGCFGGAYKKYGSIEDSIIDFINEISKKFYTKEMQIPSKMYKDYGKSSAWAFKVNKIMEKVKKVKVYKIFN